MKTALSVGGSFRYWHLYWFYQRYNVYNYTDEVAIIRTIGSHDQARRTGKNRCLKYHCYLDRVPVSSVLRFYKDSQEIAIIVHVSENQTILIDYHLAHHNKLLQNLYGPQRYSYEYRQKIQIRIKQKTFMEQDAWKYRNVYFNEEYQVAIYYAVSDILIVPMHLGQNNYNVFNKVEQSVSPKNIIWPTVYYDTDTGIICDNFGNIIIGDYCNEIGSSDINLWIAEVRKKYE